MQQRVKSYVRSFLYLQCKGILSVVLSLAATVLRVIFLLRGGSGTPNSIVSGRDMS